MSVELATDFPGFDAQTFASEGNAILGIRDSGKSYTAIGFAERLFDAGIPFVAFDPIGRWRFLRVPGRGQGYPIVVAGGAAGDLPLTVDGAPEIVRAAMEGGVSLVIDLYDIQISKADWKRIVGESVRVLLYENGAHGLRHIFIEEAAEFAPQRVGPDQGRVYAEIEKLARMGGNARLGYTLINQRAEEVNKAILELCDNLFLHRQKGKNSLASLTKWLDLADVNPGSKEIIKHLPTLPQGECWAWMSGTSAPVHVKVPTNNSFAPDRRAMRGEVALAREPVDVDAFVKELRARLAGEEAPVPAPAPAPKKRQPTAPKEEPNVKESEARALREENERLKARLATLEAKPNPPAAVNGATLDVDAILAELKRRAATDPEIIALLTKKPEIVVTVKRETLEMSTDDLSGRIALLISEGFFDEGASGNGAMVAMRRRGWSHDPRSTYRACDALTVKGFLTKEKDGYRAVAGVKVRIVEA